MKQPLVRPIPAGDESAQGYLLRLADSNAFPSARTVQRTWLNLHPSQASLRGPICGLRSLNQPDAGGLKIRHWNTQRPRYCPICLAESGHWRSAWSLSFCVACPVHLVALVDDCLCCGRPLKWRRPQVTRCSCGADLVGRCSVGAGEGAVDLSRQLATFLHKPLRPGESCTDLQLLLERTWLLGTYQLQLSTRAQKLGGLHEVAKAAQVVEAAAQVVADWPRGYFKFLEGAAVGYGTTSGSSIVAHFGPLYRELFRGARHAFNADLRDGFESYLRMNWAGQLAKRNRRLSGEAVATHEWVPVTRAARALGWSIPRVQQGILQGRIRGKVQPQPSGRMTGVVHGDELRRLQELDSLSLDLLTTCRTLRMGKKRVHGLIKRGELAALSGPSIDGRQSWRFRRCDVEKLKRAYGPNPKVFRQPRSL